MSVPPVHRTARSIVCRMKGHGWNPQPSRWHQRLYTGHLMGRLDPQLRRFRRPFWATVAFLLGFTVLLVIVSNYFLLPAISAARGADASGRHQLSAVSALLLAVLLVTLIVGLFLTFRIHRF